MRIILISIIIVFVNKIKELANCLYITMLTHCFIWSNEMITHLVRPRAVLFLALIVLSFPTQAEKITVDKEEYENLKKAVEYLMSQQKEVIDKASRAEEKADEATEIAIATAEVIEDSPIDALEGITIGGYGEAHYNNLDADDSTRDLDEADLHRFVVYLSKEFRDDLRFVSEVEIEHGGVEADGDPLDGEVEVEQAYIEYDINDTSQVRGGVFLVPVGILNETHEPPTFYGVERNDVENIIIPTTWWEAGFGGTHRFWDSGFSADLAITNGLDIPTSGSSLGRIRSGRQKVSNADASDLAGTARLKYTGIQGLELAATLHHQTGATQEDSNIIDDATLYSMHAIYNRGPFALRTLYAAWDIDGDLDKEPGDPSEQDGWYVEPSFKPLDWLGLYARYEDIEGARFQDQFDQWELGFNIWPHEDVVLKADYRDREHDRDSEGGRDFDGFDLGIGWMF